MKLELYYPAKPWIINQGWGIYNPFYGQFGFWRHNGIDFRLGKDSTLYSPIKGTIVRSGNQPTGGGIFFGLMSDDEYTFPDGKVARIMLDFLHCESILVTEGQKVGVGDTLAIADNTGASTGPHTHMQPRRVKFWNLMFGEKLEWTTLDVNDANNTFDPTPYWNGKYAVDVQIGLLQQVISLLQKLLPYLKPVK